MLLQKLEMGYCPNCVVTKGLGSWALGAQAKALRGAGHGAQGSEGQAGAGGRAGRAAGMRGARGRDARGARHGRWACGLGVLLG